MPLHDILVVYLISTLLVFLPSFGLAPLFEKAGAERWKAYIPFYNTWVMQELTKRPKHWVFWQFIPVVGWFITPGIFIEFAKAFGKFGLRSHTMAALLPFFYFPYLAYKQDPKFIGYEGVRRHKKPSWREWVDAAIFAVVAATLIRTFVFEAYTIPSGSMEKSLLVRDFLFVSKLSYGPRIPNTPLSIPFVHNYSPIGNGKSYTRLISLPYVRWFRAMPKRNDVVVFNFPQGDTVVHRKEFESAIPYYSIVRKLGRDAVLQDPQFKPLVVHPVDKTDNYIKRCIAVAGDTLQIIKGDVYINGKLQPVPSHSGRHYLVKMQPNRFLGPESLKDMGIDMYDNDFGLPKNDSGYNYEINLTQNEKAILEKSGLTEKIAPVYLDRNHVDPTEIFPYDTLHPWAIDDYGPIWIPKKGATLKLVPQDYPIYERTIRNYEGNDFYMQDGKFFLNGKEVTEYTFKMDYFWMMGDNRHGSQDSRFWGFVPEDRIVGKAWLIWFSWENGPRWKRLFRIVK